MYVKDGDKTIVLCHFPIAEWNRYWRGGWHIYGHIHNRKKGCYDYISREERALNAGCMINNYTPATIVQLIENNEKFHNNLEYLTDLYGEHVGPRELDDGSWILPTEWSNEEHRSMEWGDIHYIFSEYCWSGLSYHFYTREGFRDHEHTFAGVLYAAYQYPFSFCIKEEDEQEYSKQELEFLHKFLEKYRKERVLDNV